MKVAQGHGGVPAVWCGQNGDALAQTDCFCNRRRRALELDPALLEIEFNKRDFYGDPSDFDRHILLLQSYLNDHILDDDARLLLGANHLFGGDPDATVALFSDSFSKEVRNSDSGRLLLAAAQRAIAAH